MKIEPVQSSFENLCRICSSGCDKSHMVSIFESDELLEQITSCLPINIHEGDSLPHEICENCLHLIQSSFELIKTAQASEKYFFSCLSDGDNEAQITQKNTIIRTESSQIKKKNQITLDLDGSFQCDICGIQLSEALDLDNHIQEKHVNESIQPSKEFIVNKICSLCGQLFDSEEVYQLHKCETQHQCLHCKKTMPTKCLLNRHIQHSCKQLYYCPHCHKTFGIKSLFLSHVKGHTGAECKSECLACDQYMRGSGGEVTEHTCNQEIESSPSVKPYKCYICGQAYKRQLNLAKHCLQHEPKTNWQYKCMKCDEVFEKEKMLHAHYERIHKMPKTWICRFCGKSLSTKLSVQIHERIHTQMKPFVCEWCGNRFRCKSNLIQHHAIHTGIRRHTCQYCGKMFSRPFFLQTHVRIHTGERPYKCELCPKRFKQLTDMKRHRKRHDKSFNNVQVAEENIIYVDAISEEQIETLEEVTYDSFPIATVEYNIETSYD